MLILTIRTENPEAELGLYIVNKKLDYYVWHADRELSETILTNIKKLLVKNSYTLEDLGGIIIYQGPGSFTGLRIGFSVANTLAYSLDCRIVTTNEDNWIHQGIELLQTTETSKQVFPFYGAEANITQAKK